MLRWIDIDQSRRTVKIRRSVVDVAGRVIVKDTKTHAQRVIALDPGTIDRLVSHRDFVVERAGMCGTELPEDAFVLSHAVDDSKPLRPEHATNVFRTLRAKAGVPNARVHDLRHFVATQHRFQQRPRHTHRVRSSRTRQDVHDARHLRRLPRAERPSGRRCPR